MPGGLSLGHGERPIEQISDMCEDLYGSAAILAGVEVDVGLRGVANNFAGAIGDGGEGVSKEIACADGVWWVHGGIKLAGSWVGRKEGICW